MKTINMPGALIVLLLVLGFASCGGSGGGGASLLDTGGQAEDTTPVLETEVQPEADVLGGLPRDAWVDPAEILARRGSEFLERSKPGAEYFVKSANTEASDGMLGLVPGSAGTGAWVVYQFDDLIDADYPIKATLAFHEELTVPGTCWLGISDYGLNNWDWTCYPEPGLEIFAHLPVDGSAISPGGNLYLVVMALDCAVAVLDSVSLELDTDDPPPPAGLDVSRGTFTDHIELAWDDPAETWSGLEYTAVAVERAPDRTGPWEQLAEVPAGTFTFADTSGMEPGLQWYYRLRTVTGELAGWAGATGKGWPAVADVTWLTATDGEWDRITLTWAPVEHADGYLVKYIDAGASSVPDLWSNLAWIDDPAVTTCIHSEIEPAGLEAVSSFTYHYRVYALEEGTRSSGIVVDSGSYVSAKVTNLTANGTPDYIELTWDAVAGATDYRIEYKAETGDPVDWTLLAEVDGVTTFRHGEDDPPGLGAEYGTLYDYRVKAFSGDLEALEWSDEVVRRREVGAVQGITTSSTGELIQINWYEMAGAEGYLLEYRDANGVDPADWTTLAEGPVADFQDDPLGDLFFHHTWAEPAGREARAGMVYAYHLKAYRGEEYSQDWSDIKNAKRQTVWDYDAFTASENRINEVEFTVGNCYNATGLRIEYRNLDGGDPADWTLLQTTLDDHTATSPTGRECAADTDYEYRIKGTAGDVESVNWASDTGRRGMVDVVNFTATDGWFDDRIILSWERVYGMDGYLLEYRDRAGAAPADWTLLAEPEGSETTTFEHTLASPSGLEAVAGVIYEYRIKARLGAVYSSNWTENSGVCGFGPGRWAMEEGNALRNSRSAFTGPVNPEVKWTRERCYQAVVGCGGDIYTVGTNAVDCLEEQGNLLFSLEKYSNGMAIDPNGDLLVAGSDITQYHPDGSIIWSAYFAPGKIMIGADSTIYGVLNGKIRAINDAGIFQWSYDTGYTSAYHHFRPAQGPGGDTYTMIGGILYCLNQSGELQWTYDGAVNPGRTSVADDGTILFLGEVSSEAILHALHPDGTEYWATNLGFDRIDDIPVAIGADGTAYVRSSSSVFAVAADGTPAWECPVTDLGEGGVLIGADGFIYGVTRSCDLFAVTAVGALDWTMSLSTSTDAGYCDLLPGGDGILYAISEDDDGLPTLFAIGEI